MTDEPTLEELTANVLTDAVVALSRRTSARLKAVLSDLFEPYDRAYEAWTAAEEEEPRSLNKCVSAYAVYLEATERLDSVLESLIPAIWEKANRVPTGPTAFYLKRELRELARTMLL